MRAALQWTRAVALQVAIIAGVAFALYAVSRAFPVESWIAATRDRLGAFGFWGAVLYPAILAICNLLLLPGGVLAIGSGLFYGLWWGLFLVWLGTVSGCAAAFGIGRTLGRSRLEKLLHRNPRWAALDHAIALDGAKIVFLSQVHPLFPTSLLNYLYGATSIRFSTCMAAVATAQIPGLFLYAYLGTLAQHGSRVVRGDARPAALEYVLWIGGLLLTLVVTTGLARMAAKLAKDFSNPTGQSPAQGENKKICS